MILYYHFIIYYHFSYYMSVSFVNIKVNLNNHSLNKHLRASGTMLVDLWAFSLILPRELGVRHSIMQMSKQVQKG